MRNVPKLMRTGTQRKPVCMCWLLNISSFQDCYYDFSYWLVTPFELHSKTSKFIAYNLFNIFYSQNTTLLDLRKTIITRYKALLYKITFDLTQGKNKMDFFSHTAKLLAHNWSFECTVPNVIIATLNQNLKG